MNCKREGLHGLCEASMWHFIGAFGGLLSLLSLPIQYSPDRQFPAIFVQCILIILLYISKILTNPRPFLQSSAPCRRLISQPKKLPQPQSPPGPTVQLGSHIQKKTQSFPSPPLVEINDILYALPTTPLHHPIMSIKRPLVTQPSIHSRPRGQLAAIPTKTPQPGTTT